MGDPQKKLELLEDKLVEQIVFDVLHMKLQQAYEKLGVEVHDRVNHMQHDTYKEIVGELKKRYKQQIEKQSITN